MRTFLIILISISMTACLNEASKESSNVEQPYFRNQLLSSKSPNGKRLLTLTEIGYDSTNCYTQVLLDFGGSGSGVYATNGKNLGIKTYWKGNDTIVIETKKEYKAHQEWPQVQSFDDVVKVEYIKK
jgi:uncharacterized FlgJ-related protein